PLIEEGASLEQARGEQFSVRAILGEDPKVEEVRTFVRRRAAIPRPTVLLLGESGTGKNLAARAIHYSSPHSRGRFVEINCSALPANLLEAELFGYKKGAFTDAREAKRGLIEVADGGTLFLDEIAELGPELQAKLLNVLESRRFRRLGSTEELEVALRLVTATNRDLEQLVQAGRFRSARSSPATLARAGWARRSRWPMASRSPTPSASISDSRSRRPAATSSGPRRSWASPARTCGRSVRSTVSCPTRRAPNPAHDTS